MAVRLFRSQQTSRKNLSSSARRMMKKKFEKYPNLIHFNDKEDLIKIESSYYYDVTGVSSDEFYARLDVKAIFSARWESDNRIFNCIVAQENGELKAYVR